MTKQELLENLSLLSEGVLAPEVAHWSADALLLAYIDDPDISEAYIGIRKKTANPCKP